MNNVTGARKHFNVSAKALRRERQAEELAGQERDMAARPNEPPADRTQAGVAHPWDVQPGESCQGRRRHDFSRKDSDGLYRCWYCSRLSPRSRAKVGA